MSEPTGAKDNTSRATAFTAPTSEEIARTAVALDQSRRDVSWASAAPLPDDLAPLQLAEVNLIARAERPGEWHARMTALLPALHEPGHALALVLFGDGERQRLYYGGRRVVGGGASSTSAYLGRVIDALQAEFVGLGFAGPPAPLGHPSHAPLGRFLATSRVIAAVTGLPTAGPSGRDGMAWTLDRVARLAGRVRFAALTVAEAVTKREVEEQIALLREMLSFVYPAVRQSIQEGWQQSESASVSMTKQILNAPSASDPAVDEAWRVLRRYGVMIPGIGTSILALQNFAGGTLTQQGQQGSGESGGKSFERFDAEAEALLELIRRRLARLSAARGCGAWRAVTYLAADDEATIDLVAAAYRGLLSGEASGDEPITVHRLTSPFARSAIATGQVLYLPASSNDRAGSGRSPLVSLLASRELAAAMQPPADGLLGLEARRTPTFGRSAPVPAGDAIQLGRLEDSGGRAIGDVGISARALNRHTMVVGKTGFGKSNTCLQLLLEAWTRLKIPFLVLEPAKAEYRRLAQVPELSGRLRVYAIGADSPLPLRLNPLSPVPGIPLARHIDLLKGVFNASFPMGAGMPYVLEDALHDLFRDRGWNLATSRNRYLGRNATADDIAALTPDLTDLYEQIEVVLERKGYSAQIQSDLGAALRSRINSLRQGNKGVTLDARRSILPSDLFDEPSVIELTNLGDDEEKAFVMALLLVLLYEYGEVRHHARPPEARAGLRHLTLVEEAHRLLKATHRTASTDVGDPARKAVTMFTDMLAEMRAYGEGFIIADQIPSDLAPQIIKNTDVKIVHRLTAPDDRKVVAQSIDLNEEQTRHLTNLEPGVAVVHSEDVPAAVTVRVAPVTRDRVRDVPTYQLRHFLEGISLADRRYLHRHAGCRHCPKPGVFAVDLGAYQEIESEHRLRLVFDGLLRETQMPSWQAWLAWRAGFSASSFPGATREDISGLVYCAATNAGYRWLESLTPEPAGSERAPARSARPEMARLTAVEAKRPISPVRRLERERIAGIWADWLWSWSECSDDSEPPSEMFLRSQEALVDMLVKDWPRSPAPCPRCGERCAVLPEVALALPALLPVIERNVSASLPPVAKIEALRQSVGRALPGWQSGELTIEDQDHRLCCLLLNSDLQDELMVKCREMTTLLTQRMNPSVVLE